MRDRPAPPLSLPPSQACDQLDGWTPHTERPAISKSFRFQNFAEAFGFMSEIAILAERADHHPEWFNVYNRLDVVLTTHESGGVTERDVGLAKAMDAAFRTRQNRD